VAFAVMKLAAAAGRQQRIGHSPLGDHEGGQ
jgi:hypothetical protein